MRHISLSDADVLFETTPTARHGISPHATAIAGILIGLDPQAAMAEPKQHLTIAASAQMRRWMCTNSGGLRPYGFLHKNPLPRMSSP
jgi:hypothetical protein